VEEFVFHQIEQLVFDVRRLQLEAALWRPSDRLFLSLLLGVPSWVYQAVRVFYIADKILPLPTCLAERGEAILYAPPYSRVPTLVVLPEYADSAYWGGLSEKKRSYTRFVEIVGSNGEAGGGRVAVGQRWLGDCNHLIDLFGFNKVLSSLESLQLNSLFGDKLPVLAVDGSLCADRDFSRGLEGLIRAFDVRVVVFGVALPKPSARMLSLFPTPAMLSQIVAQACVVLVPERGNSFALSEFELGQLGGRCLLVDKKFPAQAMFDLLGGIDTLNSVNAGLAEVDQSWDADNFWRNLLDDETVSFPTSTRRPIIALMSPMFPEKGGPPHSSLDLMLALAEIADVDVWTNAEMLPVHRSKARAVRRIDGDFDSDHYDAVIYVMGNHPMYIPIYNHMKVNGGALILHDAHMMDFLWNCYPPEQLCQILSKESDKPIPVNEVDALTSNPEKLKQPYLSEIIKYGNPVIVHSPTAASIINQLYGVNVMYFPVGMPYPFRQEELSGLLREKSKLALGIDQHRPCIVSFGEVHWLKGAKQCIFVVKELVEWGYDFQFVFVGPVSDELRQQLSEMAQQYGVSEYITLVGGVSEEKYIQYLLAGDIVLQIRKIPFGQVSGALLDAVSAGMHGVASENLAASIEAPECVVRVNDEASPTLYAENIAELIDSGAYLQRPGPGWDGFVEKHAFARYARKLISVLLGSKRGFRQREEQ
jgi:glycosyltransferase involved in cell wall biosynthesis